MAGSDGWIEQRGRRYLARWRDADGKKRSEPCESREAAELVLLKVKQGKRAGTYTPPSEVTVREVVERYLARARHRVRGGSAYTYARRAETYVLPALGSVRVQALTVARVQVMVDAMQDRGLAPMTIKGAVLVLHAALGEAQRLGIVTANAASGVVLPVAERRARDVWSLDEIRRVLDTLRDQPLWHALYALMLSSGMRPGEALVLRWSDVDLDTGVVHVRRTRTTDADGHTMAGSTTKGKRARVVAIGTGAVTALRVHRQDQERRRAVAGGWRAGDAVFDGVRGSLGHSTWQEYHAALVDRLGVTPITLHGMRHTAATIMMRMNVHPKVVSEMLGHKNIGITLDTYSHSSADLQQDAAVTLDGVMFGE